MKKSLTFVFLKSLSFLTLLIFIFSFTFILTACSSNNKTKNNYKKDSSTYSKSIEVALAARLKAYAPYSNYLVGSAIKTKAGKIYQGCNVENAAYGATNCAERTALFSAIAAGERDFSIVIVASKDGAATPCGICRQVLNEFNPDMLVIMVDEKGNVKNKFKLSQLLPQAFGPKNLNK